MQGKAVHRRYAVEGERLASGVWADGDPERTDQKKRDLAREDVLDYIEVFYNRKRRHSHLGGVSPEAFEQASF